MNSHQPVVRVHELVKRYGERAVVDGASFEIARGETFALLATVRRLQRSRADA